MRIFGKQKVVSKGKVVGKGKGKGKKARALGKGKGKGKKPERARLQISKQTTAEAIKREVLDLTRISM